jgi:hypothetical protein
MPVVAAVAGCAVAAAVAVFGFGCGCGFAGAFRTGRSAAVDLDVGVAAAVDLRVAAGTGFAPLVRFLVAMPGPRALRSTPRRGTRGLPCTAPEKSLAPDAALVPDNARLAGFSQARPRGDNG